MRPYIAIAILICSLTDVHAQPIGVKRNVLSRIDTTPPGHEAVMAQIEVAPGVSTGRHTHNGIEIG